MPLPEQANRYVDQKDCHGDTVARLTVNKIFIKTVFRDVFAAFYGNSGSSLNLTTDHGKKQVIKEPPVRPNLEADTGEGASPGLEWKTIPKEITNEVGGDLVFK